MLASVWSFSWTRLSWLLDVMHPGDLWHCWIYFTEHLQKADLTKVWCNIEGICDIQLYTLLLKWSQTPTLQSSQSVFIWLPVVLPTSLIVKNSAAGWSVAWISRVLCLESIQQTEILAVTVAVNRIISHIEKYYFILLKTRLLFQSFLQIAWSF